MLKPFASLKLVLVSTGSLAVILVLLGLWKIPQWQVAPVQQQIDALKTQPNPPDPKDIATLEKSRIDAENAARTVLVQGIGGFFIFVTAGVAYLNFRETRRNVNATERNVRATEEKQIAERFGKAVELLGSPNIYARLGGIYSLEQIAKDAEEKYYWHVMETLASYLRKESPVGKPQIPEIEAFKKILKWEKEMEEVMEKIVVSGMESSLAEIRKKSYESMAESCKIYIAPAEDVLVIMTVLERLNHKQQGQTRSLDLSFTDLPKINLGFDAEFSRINLSCSNLKGALLPQINFQEAILMKADFRGAFLCGANLHLAMLGEANLQNANLSNADLSYADCEGSNLYGTNFEQAILDRANLQFTVGLTWEQLQKAASYEEAVLPDYLLQQNQPSTEPSSSVMSTTVSLQNKAEIEYKDEPSAS